MLHGKTALITGGSSGIGLATARLLHDNGARVADLRHLQQELEEAFGSLDILFANAGVAFATPIESPDEAISRITSAITSHS